MVKKLRKIALFGYLMMVIPPIFYMIIFFFYKGDRHIFDKWILLVSGIGGIVLGICIFAAAIREIKEVFRK